MQKGEKRDDVALNAAERKEVLRILREHVPGMRVWVFGSRVTGNVKAFSDLDLGLEGAEELTLAQQAELAEAFEESDLPFRVDVVDLLSAEAWFSERVRQEGVSLQPGL